MKSKAPFAVITVFVLILLVAPSDAAITCSNIVKSMSPCTTHLRSSGTKVPPAACCSGLKSVASSARSASDKMAVCGCVRAAFRQTKVTDATAKALPSRCGVTLPFSVSSNIKCS